MFAQSMNVAMAIYRAIEVIIYEQDKAGVVVEAYSNGREQGLFIRGTNGVASFSESRNSDDIVVYLGERGEFAMQGNVPSERAYKENHYLLEPFAFTSAAKRILSHVTGRKYN